MKQRVLVAVLGEPLDLAVAVGPGRVFALGLVELALIDVVAETDDEVEVVLAQESAMAGVVAGDVVLAAKDPDLDRSAGSRRWQGAELADARALAVGLEAVEVALVRIEPGDPRLDRMVELLSRTDLATLDDPVEAPVLRYLESESSAPLYVRELRPKRHRTVRGLSRGDALQKLPTPDRPDRGLPRSRGKATRGQLRSRRGAQRNPGRALKELPPVDSLRH